ncbi:cation:proton antiporter regulatory subunit [Trichothermofontia sichuanensis]|uniref:cation:proton antiporter regulatory subunit n=1 Tax=Trichothermofontia sichuanensis TaxID=3045816 RepID=UPI0036F2675B
MDGILTGSDRTYYVEEYLLEPTTCNCLGQSLREARLRSQTGVLVLAIRRRDGTLIAGPTAETILEAGDLLICMGTAEQLRSLNQLLSPLRPDRLRPPGNCDSKPKSQLTTATEWSNGKVNWPNSPR